MQDILPYLPLILIALPHFLHFTNPESSANFPFEQEKWKQKKEEYQSQIDKLSNEINNIVSLLNSTPNAL